MSQGHINPFNMTLRIVLISSLAVALLPMLSSCDREDPGPMQSVRKEFAITDFDRLEMGSALHIEVEQASTFTIEVRGDRRNIDDLEVYKSGSTLVVEYEDNNNRHYDTHVYITMPVLEAVNFSGASVSKIRGFDSDEQLDFYLSGASVSQLDSDFRKVNVVVSAASSLYLTGNGDELNVKISGASSLKAFDYPVRQAALEVSGASDGKVTAIDELIVTASEASSVLYRGNPSLTANTSGSSAVVKD